MIKMKKYLRLIFLSMVVVMIAFTMGLSETARASSLGEEIKDGELTYYYDDETKATSLVITSDGISWLNHESDGISTLFGVDNYAGSIEYGTIFSVSIWSKNDYHEYYERISDDSRVTSIGEDKILLIDFKTAEGIIIPVVPNNANILIELGDEYSLSDIMDIVENSSMMSSDVEFKRVTVNGNEHDFVSIPLELNLKETSTPSTDGEGLVNQNTDDGVSSCWVYISIVEGVIIIGLIVAILIMFMKMKRS